MSLDALATELADSRPAVVSSDLFDTVLLRDHTTEIGRWTLGCRRVADEWGVDPRVLLRLRWSFHYCAYRAVAMRRPDGDASLARICRAMADAVGLGDREAGMLHEAEVAVEVEHLRPNRRLLDILSRSGSRRIAVSDMYYSGEDLQRIVSAVVGSQPFSAVYSSSDLGFTKHSGAVFDRVAYLEGTPGSSIVHVGDNYAVDVEQARAAGWRAVHLPRSSAHQLAKTVGKVMAFSTGTRRLG